MQRSSVIKAKRKILIKNHLQNSLGAKNSMRKGQWTACIRYIILTDRRLLMYYENYMKVHKKINIPT